MPCPVEEPDRAAQERPVRLARRRYPPVQGRHRLGQLPVGHEVMTAAQPVVIHPGDVRLGGIDPGLGPAVEKIIVRRVRGSIVLVPGGHPVPSPARIVMITGSEPRGRGSVKGFPVSPLRSGKRPGIQGNTPPPVIGLDR